MCFPIVLWRICHIDSSAHTFRPSVSYLLLSKSSPLPSFDRTPWKTRLHLRVVHRVLGADPRERIVRLNVSSKTRLARLLEKLESRWSFFCHSCWGQVYFVNVLERVVPDVTPMVVLHTASVATSLELINPITADAAAWINEMCVIHFIQ